ncbi:MAG: hypothetical protein EOO56_05405 [Hymenobacter sp.]|nr:MAG: hypothetical protein EOO56_05405 [Hymenobacter sp.]
MKKLLYSLLPVLLLGLLASCSVYENIVHPRRLPTPDMNAQAKAKFKAAEKARHKGTVLKTEEITTGATDPNAPAGSEAKKDNKLTYSELPEGTRNKYDKNLLIKNKPKLTRRQYHIYKTKPLHPRQASRENRRLRKHSKGPDKGRDHEPKTSKAVEADSAPAAEPTPDVQEPQAKEVKGREPKEPKVKAPKVKRSKNEPKPDPTQPSPGN